MGDHPAEGDTHRRDQTEKDVELPEAIDGAAEQKSQSQDQAAAADDFFSAEPIQEIADHGGKNCIYGKHHGKNSGGGATAPTKIVEQGHVENPEGRMETAGKTKNNEGKRCDQPGCRRKTHEDR